MEGSATPRIRRLREDALAVLEAGIRAGDPESVVETHLRRRGDGIYLADEPLRPETYERVRLLAIGKASPGLARAVLKLLPVDGGLLVAPSPAEVPHPGLTQVAAGHPIPNGASFRAGKLALDLARDCGPDDLLLVLLSGGGSALAEDSDLPADDVRAITRHLLRSGLDITAVNAVRKHLSNLKGGRLGKAAARNGATVITLAMSDVVGDDPTALASGPTVPDPTTFDEAVDTLAEAGLWKAVPPSVREHLEAGRAGRGEETPKPGDPDLARGRFVLLVGGGALSQAAADEAGRRGYRSFVLSSRLRGEARRVGATLAALSQTSERRGPPTALVFAGETTVTVRGEGRGGRNQELVLAAVPGLAGREVLLASVDTDGHDGTTDVAGALADGWSRSRGEALGLDPEAHLADNDAHAYFRALGDVLVTGPTGTNVLDLGLLLTGPPAEGTQAGSG